MVEEMRPIFVDVGEATVHVRVTGPGPVTLLLHEAQSLESRAAGLSKDFFWIAPNLPGLGQSDELRGGLVTVAGLPKRSSDCSTV